MRARIAVIGVVAVVSGACAAPPASPYVPPPVLPAGIGVQWARDAGGTNNPVDGSYTPDAQQYVTIDGSTTGPTPTAGMASIPFNPAVWVFGGPKPNGSATFPYNGFAGEGITWANVSDVDVVYFSGGSCGAGITGTELSNPTIAPSPDGTRIAVLSRDISWPQPRMVVAIRELADTAGLCPLVATAEYGEPLTATEGEFALPPLVWSPNSSAVVYPVSQDGPSWAMDRLDAEVSATPVRVVDADTNTLFPLGWSVADRLLVHEIGPSGASSATSELVTMNLGGGARRTIDVATFETPFPEGYEGINYHHGFFVPGTTSIVYNDGSTSVTNTDGKSFPWFQIHLIADAPGAISGPLTGTAPTLSWHQENIAAAFDPPEYTDVPNAETIGLFTH